MSPTRRSAALLALLVGQYEPPDPDTSGKPAGDVGAGRGDMPAFEFEQVDDDTGRHLIRRFDLTPNEGNPDD